MVLWALPVGIDSQGHQGACHYWRTSMIVTDEMVAKAKAGLWKTRHFPVNENDEELPSADHPDFVGFEQITYPDMRAALEAALEDIPNNVYSNWRRKR
jgi:hypothetical protein